MLHEFMAFQCLVGLHNGFESESGLGFYILVSLSSLFLVLVSLTCISVYVENEVFDVNSVVLSRFCNAELPSDVSVSIGGVTFHLHKVRAYMAPSFKKCSSFH